MKKKDLLYEFIQSLDKNEVTFFKKYVNLFSKGKTPAYYTIFEYFLKSKNFDESIIKKKIGSSYAVHKNLLFDRLVSALSSLNSQDNPISKSLDYITVASIAAKKQLYNTAEYLVDKADKNMANQPALTMPLFIQHFKMLLLKSPHKDNGDIETAKQLFNEIKTSTQDYLIHHELNLLSIQIYNLGRSKKDNSWDSLLKEIEENEWVKNYHQISNPIDQLAAIKLNYKLAILKGNYDKAYALQEEEIKIIEANENLIRLNPMNYLVPLYNIIDEAIRLKSFDVANSHLSKMNSIPENYNFADNQALHAAIQSYSIPLQSKLLAAIDTEKIEVSKIKNLLHLADNFNDSNEKASLAHQTNFYCAIAFMKLQNYSDALGLLAVFEYENHEKRILLEFETSVELLRLICFYELELTELFEAKIRSISRTDNHKKSTDYLSFFRALLKGISKKDALKLLPNEMHIDIQIFANYFAIWKNL